MKLQVEMKPDASGKFWNLYVNGHVALALESYGVCSAVQAELESAAPRGFYSEAAEVADTIRRTRAGAR